MRCTARKITAPTLVFGKTYVALKDFAEILNFEIVKNDAENKSLNVMADGVSVGFKQISRYDELSSQQYKFFIKDDKIFVALRELTDSLKYSLKYIDGIIVLSKGPLSNDGSMTESFEKYVLTQYPPKSELVVNPYRKYSYENMLEDADKLAKMYPDLIKLSSIGKSVEDRNLLLVEFGRGDTKIFVCGTHHAREYICTTYLMYAIDRYAYAYRNNGTEYKDVKYILDKVTFCIVPMVNPDGVNLVQNGVNATSHASEIKNMKIYEGSKYGYSAWKANIRGVDVNWNYDKLWTEDNNKNPRGSSGFGGDRPNTEPETIAISNYVDNNYFDAYLSYHTQGEIFYWADSKAEPVDIYNTIKKSCGFTGYRSGHEEDGGSFFDYVYRKYDKPTVTIELCPYIGNYPYPDKNFDTVWKPAKNIMLAMANQFLYKKSQK